MSEVETGTITFSKVGTGTITVGTGTAKNSYGSTTLVFALLIEPTLLAEMSGRLKSHVYFLSIWMRNTIC